jgi:hypothetical protein
VDTRANLESIAKEFDAVKDRVRNLIGDAHWPSDGVAKESVLRDVLRRYLPATVGVGTGFVVDIQNCSGQIDVLIFDNSKPLLYRDGDFVCVTPDVAIGVIEVKTNIRRRHNLRTALEQLRDNVGFCRENRPQEQENQVFAGLFAFDTELSNRSGFLEDFRASSGDQEYSITNIAALGQNLFVRFWPNHPSGRPDYRYWHSYDLQNLAPGYFISNTIGFVAGESVRRNRSIWYLHEGKESHLLSRMPLINRGENP